MQTRLQHKPCSESEASDSGFDAADAPRAGGKPLGNAALAGTFLPVDEKNPQQNLTIQTSTIHEMLSQITFLCDSDHRRRRRGCWVVCLDLSRFTDTFDMNLFRLPQLATVFALSDGASLLLNFKQRTVGVFAVGRPVPLNACFAARNRAISRWSRAVCQWGSAYHAYFLSPTRTCATCVRDPHVRELPESTYHD